MILSKYKKLSLSIMFLALGTIGIVNLQQSNLSSQSSEKAEKPFLLEEEALKAAIDLGKDLPTFGFDNLAADWNYLQFIQYFGDAEAREVTGYSLVTDYFEATVERDPYFTQAFLNLSAANSLFAGRPDRTVELMNQVIDSSSPDLPGYPFLLWTYKAADEIIFLGDLKAAQNSFEMAAQWSEQRQDDIGQEMAERYLKSATYLSNNPDPTEAQFGAWMSILHNSQDSKTQSHILQQLRELGAEIIISPEGQIQVNPPKKA